MMEFLIIFAARYLVFLSLLSLPCLWIKGKRGDSVRVLASAAVAFLLAEGLDILFHAPRPFVAGGFEPLVSVPVSEYYASFPSGHATLMAALGMAVFFSEKAVGLIIAILAVVTGIARVAAGVHYPVDILAGFGLGAGVSALIKFAYDRCLSRWCQA
jgi:undecaprenyl-diphosphatase